MARRTYLIALLVSVAVALTGCAGLGPQPTSWVHLSDSGDIFVQWTLQDGSLTGSLQSGTPSSSPTGDLVTTDTASITGTIANGNITITAAGWLSPLAAPLTGTINNSEMMLNSGTRYGIGEMRFTPGTAADYNADLGKMHVRVLKERAQAQQEQANSAFNVAITDLPSLEEAVTKKGPAVKTTSVALDTAYAAQLSYSKTVLAGKCRTYDQYQHATDLYDAVLEAKDNLYSAAEDLDSTVSSLAQANRNLADLSAQVKVTPHQKDLMADAMKFETDSENLGSTANSQYTRVVDQASKEIEAVADYTYCV